MIRSLQKRFIRLAVLALTIAMVLVVTIVNVANLVSVRGELANTLKLLAGNNLPPVPGVPETTDGLLFPEGAAGQDSQREREASGNRVWAGNRHFRNMMNESNWFSVHFDPNGVIRNQNLIRMDETEAETGKTLARQALESGRTFGWIQDYCFLVQAEGSQGKRVAMLNGETRMAAVRTLALISGAACVGGILLAWLIMRLASRKAVDPVIRNMEQQKRFITDASHELKTPLTVISTNMELLKMEIPENPWVRSTQKQASAMRHLVDELVYLSRMEEEYPALTMEPLVLGPLLRETAESFQAMAEFGGKDMKVETDDGLRITGDRPSIQRLMSTLCDNATKYTPEGGTIQAQVLREGKYAVLRVSNTVQEPMTKDQCQQMFNRFYRADLSRSKEKSGYGIGLAIAAAIAEKHGGSIQARMEEDRLVITVRFPPA